MKLRNWLITVAIYSVGLSLLHANTEENSVEINPQTITPKIIYRFDINGDGTLDKDERMIAKRILDEEQMDKDFRQMIKKTKQLEQNLSDKSSKSISKIPGIIVSPPSPVLNDKDWNNKNVQLTEEMKALDKFQSILQSSDFDSVDQQQIENKVQELKQRLQNSELNKLPRAKERKQYSRPLSNKKVTHTSELRKEMEEIRNRIRLRNGNDTKHTTTKPREFEEAAWNLIGKSLDKFRKYDKNGDGKLSDEEKMAFLKDTEDDN